MHGRRLLAGLTSSRGKAQIVTAGLYAGVVVLVLGACWLFICNFDQLLPREKLIQSAEMAKWRPTDEHLKVFAGGVWRDPAFWRSVNVTVVTATITAAIAALIGIPAAYALSRYKVPGRSLIGVLFSSVIVLPSSSIGLCLIVMCQYGPRHNLQERLGLHVVYSLPGIIAVQLVLSLAMGICAWKAAFDSVNPRLEHVARSLGGSPWRAFWTVTLPTAKAGVIAGLILAWTRAAAEFGGVLIFCSTFAERPLAAFSPVTKLLQLHKADPLAVNMWSQIEYGNIEYGFAVGFALVFVSAASVYAIHKLGGKTYVW